MARLSCKCGYSMWNGICPNDIEYWVYSDRQMDSILDKDTISTLELMDLHTFNVWRCPQCKRLYIFDNDRTEALYIYNLEELK